MNRETRESIYELLLQFISIIIFGGTSYFISWLSEETIPNYGWYFIIVAGGINARLVMLKKYVGKK